MVSSSAVDRVASNGRGYTILGRRPGRLTASRTSIPEAGLISVILPAHNEADLLEQAVAEVVAGMRSRDDRFEVVIVENGSSDDTAGIGQRLAGQYPEVQMMSLAVADYGAALRAGFLAASGEIVVNFDVDFCDLDFLDRAVSMMRGPDSPVVVVGSKRHPGSTDTRSWPRRLVTSVFSSTLRIAFGLRVSDTHGVKALRRVPLVPIVERCGSRQDLFDTELILRAERAGFRSAEIPTRVLELRPARSSMLRRLPRTVAGLGRLRLALWKEQRSCSAEPTVLSPGEATTPQI